LAFLAYGAPSKHPSPTLFIERSSVTNAKRKQPINPSQVVDLSRSKRSKVSTEDSSSERDIPSSIASITKPKHIKEEYPFKEEIKSIRKSDEVKLNGYGTAKAALFKKNTIEGNHPHQQSNKFSTPIRYVEDPITKAKKALDDYSAAYELISKGTFGLHDQDTLDSMKRTVKIQAKHYFELIMEEQKKSLPHLFSASTATASQDKDDDYVNFSSPE
jgi:hypothetical protein